MKKIIILLTIATSFIGCSESDDVNTETLSEQIIGTWSPTRFVYQEGTQTIYDRQATECQIQSRNTYSENGSYSNLNFVGATLVDCSSALFEGTYSLNGNVLSRNTGSGNSDVTIEINGNTLILKWMACNFTCDNWNTHYYQREN